MRHIWSLSDSNGIRNKNLLVRNRQPFNLYGRVFFYELSACGFESSCSHLNLGLNIPFFLLA